MSSRSRKFKLLDPPPSEEIYEDGTPIKETVKDLDDFERQIMTRLQATIGKINYSPPDITNDVGSDPPYSAVDSHLGSMMSDFGMCIQDGHVYRLDLFQYHSQTWYYDTLDYHAWEGPSYAIEIIAKLPHLRILDFSDNGLDSDDLESIATMKSLRKLDLSCNHINTIPESFSNLTSLTYLNLKGNTITALPKSFGKLTSLISLDLRDNKLTKFPAVLSKLPALGFLNLEDNRNPIEIPANVMETIRRNKGQI